MPTSLAIEFANLTDAKPSTVVTFAAKDLELGVATQELDVLTDGQIKRAAHAAEFVGKDKSKIELLAPTGIDTSRLVLMGVGDAGKKTPNDWIKIGGQAAGAMIAAKAASCGLIADIEVDGQDPASIASNLAMGCVLRHYEFRKYKTREKRGSDEGDETANAGGNKLEKLVIFTADPKGAEQAFQRGRAIADGVCMARDLVNEPANTLGPVEFAAICAGLDKLGLDVEILEPEKLADLSMNALLAVAQGSTRPARVAVMKWNGAKDPATAPLCFIGKGVVFDTGGISMKPAGGMEDMKGDMGGAACVTGLMAALAGRKAKINAIGIVGLVENMPSGDAQRPGDIVTSMSGQTIEVINTDAEGRLVLCDLLHFAEQTYAPRFMINLATLTGAIIVALGKVHAGLFSNNDELAEQIAAAGGQTDEKVWRMPLDKAYDKLIDTPNADMKNIGGRNAGAITAAQFLQRFVKDTPWAHIDVAGTAMASTKTDISRTWASGWGVRSLNALVEAHYEEE